MRGPVDRGGQVSPPPDEVLLMSCSMTDGSREPYQTLSLFILLRVSSHDQCCRSDLVISVCEVGRMLSHVCFTAWTEQDRQKGTVPEGKRCLTDTQPGLSTRY